MFGPAFGTANIPNPQHYSFFASNRAQTRPQDEFDDAGNDYQKKIVGAGPNQPAFCNS
jgi:hypothetical protein